MRDVGHRLWPVLRWLHGDTGRVVSFDGRARFSLMDDVLAGHLVHANGDLSLDTTAAKDFPPLQDHEGPSRNTARHRRRFRPAQRSRPARRWLQKLTDSWQALAKSDLAALSQLKEEQAIDQQDVKVEACARQQQSNPEPCAVCAHLLPLEATHDPGVSTPILPPRSLLRLGPCRACKPPSLSMKPNETSVSKRGSRRCKDSLENRQPSPTV